jgi:hypothetical protein
MEKIKEKKIKIKLLTRRKDKEKLSMVQKRPQ